VRDFEHRRAVAALEARTYDGANPLRVGAYPTYINPFEWHGVVETRNFFGLAEVNSQTPEVDPADKMEIRYKPEETPVTLAAKRSYLGRVYLDWAAFPITETTAAPDDGWIVEFHDLRFEQPLRIGGRRPLSAGVLLGRDGKVKAEFMGVVAQPAPD
jgi:inner membrane protein